jgi:hypothetical protein
LEGSRWEARRRQHKQASLVSGVEKKPLVSGVEKNRSTLRSGNVNMKREDSIVSPTLSPYTSVDLGARSLVSGVDCNDPEKSPILDLFALFFFASSWCHASSSYAFFIVKIIFPKSYFVFANYPDGSISLHPFLILKIKIK